MRSTYRKSPRLRDFDYVGPLACHLTFVTKNRTQLFTDEVLATVCLEAVMEACGRFDATLHAYCFMPDHVHLLVEVGEGVDFQALVKRMKQLSGYRLKVATGRTAWQVSYFDHVLRKEESLVDVARYIWENPVKDGLVKDPLAYPFSGPRESLEQGWLKRG